MSTKDLISAVKMASVELPNADVIGLLDRIADENNVTDEVYGKAYNKILFNSYTDPLSAHRYFYGD